MRFSLLLVLSFAFVAGCGPSGTTMENKKGSPPTKQIESAGTGGDNSATMKIAP